MVDEVVDDLFFLAVADPEDMATFHIYDVCSIAMPVMQLEFIDTEKPCLILWLAQRFAVNRICILQALLVDGLDDVFPKTGDLGYLFECIRPMGQEIPGVLVQLFRDPVLPVWLS